jgi:hypothetical protein
LGSLIFGDEFSTRYGQPPGEPNALSSFFKKKDISQISHFFKKQGISSKSSPNQIFLI